MYCIFRVFCTKFLFYCMPYNPVKIVAGGLVRGMRQAEVGMERGNGVLMRWGNKLIINS